jgi:hypothetical protein
MPVNSPSSPAPSKRFFQPRRLRRWCKRIHRTWGRPALWSLIINKYSTFFFILKLMLYYELKLLFYVELLNKVELNWIECHFKSFHVISCHFISFQVISSVIVLFWPAFDKVGSEGQICLPLPSATASLSGRRQKMHCQKARALAQPC